MMNPSIKSYLFPISLILSIVSGGFFGLFFGQKVNYLRPLGTIFLNLIFTAIVPMIFFSVSSAIARAGALKKLSRIIFAMIVVFLLTGVVASTLALVFVKTFPLTKGINLQFPLPNSMSPINFSHQLINLFTVSDFSKLLSHDHILPLIVFSILVGLAASSSPNEQGKSFIAFLQSGEAIFMRLFTLIMYYAPIGFFAYFAVFVHEFGPELMKNYVRIAVAYALFSGLYCACVYTGYAYLAGQRQGVKLFWKNIFLPMLTSLATCSSVASIPANLLATKAIGISPEIYETAVPLGTILHKEGSIVGGIVKIAFLFSVFHLDFSTLPVIITAIGVSLLVGTVMGAIPSGGMLGELLILSVYGFPTSALISIAAISIVIDPFATMLNVTGNTASSMLVARWIDGGKKNKKT